MRNIFAGIISTLLSVNLMAQPDTLLSLDQLNELSLEELMNIHVTSVSKHPEKLTEVASAIQVITAEDIRRSGATTLPEVLRLAQNLQVAKVNASQWAISARGFNNVLASKLLVMIDGRAVYTPLYAGVFWDVQNVLLKDIDRIEVISGPGGAIWGANAVNGVINIITKTAKETQGLYGEGIAGNQRSWMANLRYGGRIGDNFNYRLYGLAFKEAKTQLIPADTAHTNDEWSIGQAGIRMDWTKGEKNHLTFQSDFYDGFPNPDGKKTSAVIAMGGNALFRWTHTISEKSELCIQTYYDHTWRDFRNGFAENLKTYDMDLQYRFSIGSRQEITTGGDIRLMDHKTHNLPLFYLDPEQKLLHIYSIFLQDKITLLKERLYGILGGKVEHNVYTGFEYSPSARLLFTLPKSSIWSSVSRAVRTPSRIDRDFNLYLFENFPVIVSGNFQSAVVWAYELGYRVHPVKQLSLSLSGFYNNYDKIRSAEPTQLSSVFPFTMGNGIKGNTYGLEFSGTYQSNKWLGLKGGYTFLEKKLLLKPGSRDLNNATAESDDPTNQFLVQMLLNFSRRLESSFIIRYVDVLTNKYVPSYMTLDITMGYKLTKWLELSIAGQNLLDDSHPEFIPSSPSPREIKRSVYGKITCYFK